MSAFIVSEKQINAILTASITCKVMYNKTFEEIQRIGQALWQANYDSVNTRYNEHTQCPDLKFKTWFVNYTQAVKLIECLAYQSCEIEDWNDCYMRKVMATLKKELKELALKECGSEARYQEVYEKSDWSIDD